VRIIADTAYDSLDFTSARTHHGSKLVIDLSHPPQAPAESGTQAEPDLSAFAARLGRFATYGGGILVAQCQSRLAQELMPELLRSDALGRIRVVVLVDFDIDPGDRLRTLWGWFTRFEPARDVAFARTELHGAVARYHGRMGFDATFKSGYPDPLTLDPATEKEAQRLWTQYLEA
jgi:3-polyprenyl-4-hydroxybenzoate decarboxylase